MSSPRALYPPTSPGFTRRRQALIVALIAVALSRSAAPDASKAVLDAISLRSWREAKAKEREERRRKLLETPLYVLCCTTEWAQADVEEHTGSGTEDGRFGELALA